MEPLEEHITDLSQYERKGRTIKIPCTPDQHARLYSDILMHGIMYKGQRWSAVISFNANGATVKLKFRR